MIVTNYIDRKVYYYIDPWGSTLASVFQLIRASYNRTLGFTPDQAVFGREMLFNLISIVYWRIVTSGKHPQVDIDNYHENYR